MVTEVPPVRGPAAGVTVVTVGTDSKLNSSATPSALVPTGVVITTWTVEADSVGEVAVIWVAELTV